jgi:hypothetical protein
MRSAAVFRSRLVFVLLSLRSATTRVRFVALFELARWPVHGAHDVVRGGRRGIA